MAYVSGRVVPGCEKGDIFPLSGTATERVVQARSGIIIRMEDREMVQAQFPLSYVILMQESDQE